MKADPAGEGRAVRFHRPRMERGCLLGGAFGVIAIAVWLTTTRVTRASIDSQ